MRKISLLIVLLTSTVLAAPAKLSLPELTNADLPAGCRFESGLYPLGDHVETLYDYRHYQMVLPDLVAKDAQSIRCGTQSGTIYYFAYRNSEDRDQALLFAQPVVSRDASSAAFKNWDKGFVILSFREPPPALVEAVVHRLQGGPSSKPVLPAKVLPVAETSSAMSSASAAPVSVPAPMPVPVSAPMPTPALMPVPDSAPAPVPIPVPVPAPAPVLAPVLAPDPFEPSPNTKPLVDTHPSPPEKTIPAVVPKKAPVVRAHRPVVKRALLAPSARDPELSIEVVAGLATKLECEKNPVQAQARFVCGVLQEFATALTPDLPLGASALHLGQAYTLDSYGRFVDLHYDVLAGTEEASEASFFAYQSAGGTEDFELGRLVDANKEAKPLPSGEMLTHLRQIAAKKRVPARTSLTGRSLVVLPGGNRRVYVRKSGNHLVFVAPAGATVEEQKRNTLVIGLLY